MKYLKTNIDWFDKIMPNGLELNTLTVITGPGGSGKPLIGEAFVSAWLKAGGSIAFMSLQYPSTDFIYESVKSVTGLDLNQYKDQIIFFQLDTSINDIEKVDSNIYKANLVIPEIWEKAISISKESLPNNSVGRLIFSSALNLLLFSPTYGQKILEKVITTVKNDKSNTYMFSVSTSAKSEEIAKLEEIADNLFISRSEKPPFKLFMRVIRSKNNDHLIDEIQIPIAPETLNHIKGVADHSRMRVVPEISKI